MATNPAPDKHQTTLNQNMSCKICNRGACTESFHSLEEQEAWEERQGMSDDVDDLRREIQDLKAEIKDLISSANTDVEASPG